MITINNIEEMEKYYDEKTNTYVFDDDVEFTINIDVESNIDAYNIEAKNINACNIKARNINACNIKAGDINACNIKAGDINARDIKALDIKAYDINARDINARDINARDINAYNIDAWNINYFAFCIAYYIFKCKSAKSSRDNSVCKCLDSEIEYIK